MQRISNNCFAFNKAGGCCLDKKYIKILAVTLLVTAIVVSLVTLIVKLSFFDISHFNSLSKVSIICTSAVILTALTGLLFLIKFKVNSIEFKKNNKKDFKPKDVYDVFESCIDNITMCKGADEFLLRDEELREQLMIIVSEIKKRSEPTVLLDYYNRDQDVAVNLYYPFTLAEHNKNIKVPLLMFKRGVKNCFNKTPYKAEDLRLLFKLSIIVQAVSMQELSKTTCRLNFTNFEKDLRVQLILLPYIVHEFLKQQDVVSEEIKIESEKLLENVSNKLFNSQFHNKDSEYCSFEKFFEDFQSKDKVVETLTDEGKIKKSLSEFSLIFFEKVANYDVEFDYHELIDKSGSLFSYNY